MDAFINNSSRLKGYLSDSCLVLGIFDFDTNVIGATLAPENAQQSTLFHDTIASHVPPSPLPVHETSEKLPKSHHILPHETLKIATNAIIVRAKIA